MTAVLLGEWGFLDNLEDTSGNGIVPTVNFTPTYIDGPTPGTRAIRFSGSGQTVTYGRAGLEPPASAGGIISMAWVKVFGAHSNFTDIIHKTRAFDSTRHAIDVEGTTAFLMARWRDQLVFRETGDQFADFQWHHICNVDSDDRYAWFVDGLVLQQGARSGTAPVTWESYPWVSGYTADMGNTDSSSNVAFTGVRLFSGTMTDVEVATWMNTDIIPSGRSGKPKTWSGSAWNQHQAKIWNGSSWEAKPISGYDGSIWVPSK